MSITCTTPLVAATFATVTVAPLIITVPPMMLTVTSGPRRVAIICPSERSVDKAVPLTTW